MRQIAAMRLLGGTAVATALCLGFSGAQQTASPAAKPQAEGKSIAPYVTWFGSESAIQEPTFVKVTSDADWAALWEKHVGPMKRDNIQRPIGLPTVNFDQCMVVGIFNGKRQNTNGVIIESLTEEKDRIVLHYDESTYQVSFDLNNKGEKPTIPVRYPYGIFVLPKSDKPIEVGENVQGLKDHPAKWKPRAKL